MMTPPYNAACILPGIVPCHQTVEGVRFADGTYVTMSELAQVAGVEALPTGAGSIYLPGGTRAEHQSIAWLHRGWRRARVSGTITYRCNCHPTPNQVYRGRPEFTQEVVNFDQEVGSSEPSSSDWRRWLDYEPISTGRAFCVPGPYEQLLNGWDAAMGWGLAQRPLGRYLQGNVKPRGGSGLRDWVLPLSDTWPGTLVGSVNVGKRYPDWVSAAVDPETDAGDMVAELYVSGRGNTSCIADSGLGRFVAQFVAYGTLQPAPGSDGQYKFGIPFQADSQRQGHSLGGLDGPEGGGQVVLSGMQPGSPFVGGVGLESFSAGAQDYVFPPSFGPYVRTQGAITIELLDPLYWLEPGLSF